MSRTIIASAILLSPAIACAGVVGFVEDFNTGLRGWQGGGTQSIVSSGGVGGASDAYQLVSRPVVANLGTRTQDAEFTGDLLDDGATAIRFSLRDVGQDDDHTIHLLMGNRGVNFWLYTVPFIPTDDVWTEYSVPLTDDGNWVQIQGSGTLEDAFGNTNRLLFRHDEAPFSMTPAQTSGDFGLDRVTLVPAPSVSALAAIALASATRRRRA